MRVHTQKADKHLALTHTASQVLLERAGSVRDEDPESDRGRAGLAKGSLIGVALDVDFLAFGVDWLDGIISSE